MVLGTEGESAPPRTTLLPVGLTFHDPETFRTGWALVLVGAPIAVEDCRALAAREPERAIRELMARVAAALRQVIVEGETVGVSTWIGYSANEGKMLTLAVLDADHAEPGTEVTFVWGEEGGGSSKPTVEPHVQAELSAVVSPVPYTEVVRRSYRATKV